MISLKSIFSALVIAGAASVFFAQPAVAQTAKKLNCNGCVKSKQLKNNGIKSTDIKNGQVKNADLGNNAVSGDKVANGSLTALDLGDEAGADFDPNNDDNRGFSLTSTPTTIRTVTVVAPKAGVVIVNTSGYFSFDAGSQVVACQIMPAGSAFNFIPSSFFAENDNLISFLPFASVRAFEVPAGSFTANLVCVERTGNATRVTRPQLVALYVPTRY